ncbi:MAG: hypothetical protein A2046_10365, partial [Bacteroidetes bacterium GWA2_30_7]
GSYQQSDLYNFVYLLNVTDNDFISTANGGKIIQNDASDIIFYNVNNIRIKHKVKKYNSFTGEISIWLLFDTLKANQYNNLEMYFGSSNPALFNDTIWNNDYATFWSFDNYYNNNSINQYNQSEINEPLFNSSINNKAVAFNGNSQYIHLNDDNNLSLGANGTLISWFSINTFKDYGGIIHKGDKKNFSDEEYSLQLWNDSSLLFAIFNNNTSKKLYSSKLEANIWYYVVATWDVSGMKIYINGELDVESNQTLATQNKNGGVNIGAQLDQNFNNTLNKIYFDGLLDETAIMKSSVNQDFASVSFAMITKSSEIQTISETKSKIITLPVELTDLKGKLENNNVIISWFTLSEISNSGFYIHQSTDGINYSEIGFVNGHGTVNDINYYSFSSPNKSDGINYYKLMQVDIDGKFKFYGPISVNCKINYNVDIKTIYPDPFINELNIDLTSNAATNLKIKLIDINGRELTNDLYYIKNGFNTINLKNISNLGKGIYNLTIYDETSMFFSGKVIKK